MILVVTLQKVINHIKTLLSVFRESFEVSTMRKREFTINLIANEREENNLKSIWFTKRSNVLLFREVMYSHLIIVCLNTCQNHNFPVKHNP